MDGDLVVMCLVASLAASTPMGLAGPEPLGPVGPLPPQLLGPPNPPTQRSLPGVPVRVSWYWPALGGVNCSSFVNGKCVSRMASGERWEDWVDKASACVPEWPFGTVFTIDGKRWTCMDWGSKIKYVNGIPWVDLLQQHADYAYGTVVTATVEFAER